MRPAPGVASLERTGAFSCQRKTTGVLSSLLRQALSGVVWWYFGWLERKARLAERKAACSSVPSPILCAAAGESLCRRVVVSLSED